MSEKLVKKVRLVSTEDDRANVVLKVYANGTKVGGNASANLETFGEAQELQIWSVAGATASFAHYPAKSVDGVEAYLHTYVGNEPTYTFDRKASGVIKGKVEFMDLSNVECISMLLSHQIDIAVTHERPNLTNIISKRIFSDHTRLYVHRKFLRKKNLTLSHAKSREFVLNTPCILYKKENPPFIMAWLKYCKMELSSLKIKSICDDWSSILVMIENGLGFSLIPSSFSSRSRDVLSIDIPKDISPENIFYLLYHTDVKHIRAIKNFINAPL